MEEGGTEAAGHRAQLPEFWGENLPGDLEQEEPLKPVSQGLA